MDGRCHVIYLHLLFLFRLEFGNMSALILSILEDHVKKGIVMWRQTHLHPDETTTDVRRLDIEFGLPNADDPQHPFHRFLHMVACDLADGFDNGNAVGTETFYQKLCSHSERWRTLILQNTPKGDPDVPPILSSVQTHNPGSSVVEANQEHLTHAEGATIVETTYTSPDMETTNVLDVNPEGTVTHTAPTDSMGIHDSSVGEVVPEDSKQEEVSNFAATTPVSTSQWAAIPLLPLGEAQASCLDSATPSHLANKAPTDTKDSSDVRGVRDSARPTEVVRVVEMTPVAISHKTALPCGVTQPATLECTQQDCPSNQALSETNSLGDRIHKDSAVEVIHETVTPVEGPRNVVLMPITTIQQKALPSDLAVATAVDSPNTNVEMENGRNTGRTPNETMQRIARPPEGHGVDLRPTDRPSDSDKPLALTNGQMHLVASRDLTSTLLLTNQEATKSAEPGRTYQSKGKDRRSLRNEVTKLVMDVNSGFRMQVANLSQDGTREKQEGGSGAPCKRSSRLRRGQVSTTVGTCHTADGRRAPVVSGAHFHTVEHAWTDAENDLFFDGIVKTTLTNERDPKWKMIAKSIPSIPPESVRKRLRDFLVDHKLRGEYKEYCTRKETSWQSASDTLPGKKQSGNHDNAAVPATRMADKTKTVERGSCRPWTDEENDTFFNAIICKKPTTKPDSAWNEVADSLPALNPQFVKKRLRTFLSGNAYLTLKYNEFCKRRDIDCRRGKHAKNTKNPGEESDEEEQSRKPAAVTTTGECNSAKKGTQPRKRTHSTSSSPAVCSERMNRRTGASIKDRKKARRSRMESDEEQESWESAARTTTEEYKQTKKGTEPHKRSHPRSSKPAGCSQPIQQIHCRIGASHVVGDTITDSPVVERISKRGRDRCPRVETNVENYAHISDARRLSGASRSSRATTGVLPDTTDSRPLNSPETERRYEENRLRATRDRIQRLLLDRRQILGRDRNLQDDLCRKLEDEIERIERKLLQLYLQWEREDARAIQYDS